jgi:hypothetical protein
MNDWTVIRQEAELLAELESMKDSEKKTDESKSSTKQG